MSDTEQSSTGGKIGERRWPMATAVLTAAILQLILPHRQKQPGWWLFPILEVALLLILIVGDPGRIDRRSPRLRRLSIVLIAVMTVGNTAAAVILIGNIIRGSNDTPTLLLGRGAAIWVTNVIVFSLWYWQLDRGGPAERALGTPIHPSFLFAEQTAPDPVPEGWIPTYPDYLYLAFTSATAFSPTDTLPIKHWAKMTMMIESAVSLVLAILVVARAVNLL